MTIPVAAIQMQSGSDRQENLERAEVLIRQAAAAGARIITLPEFFDGIGPPPGQDCMQWKLDFTNVAEAEHPSLLKLSQLSNELNVYIHGGSISVRHDLKSQGIYNCSYVFAPDGSAAKNPYNKIHLARLSKDGQVFGEEGTLAGNELLRCEFEISGLPFRAGLTICYDVRFPELFRQLCEPDDVWLVFMPAAFYTAYAKGHWETLLRARAIENQVYVIAANQSGICGDGKMCYGHSMIIDPMGEILASVTEEKEAVVLAELDADCIAKSRAAIPCRTGRRLFGNFEIRDNCVS